jgi:hypothetical protein
MFALVAELTPLWKVVRSTVYNVNLAVSAIGTHDILLDRFSNFDLFDKVVKLGESVFPFLRRNNLDDTRLHTIAVDSFHL